MSTITPELAPRRVQYPNNQAAAFAYRLLMSPALRVLAPTLNRAMLASYVRPESPPTQVVLDFSSGWYAGETYEWYMKQPTKTFVSLEYRKQKEGVQHEFIVVTLSDRNRTRCRFDRMADDATRAYAPLEAGTTAKDTALVLTTNAEINEVEAAKLLLSLSFPDGEDLLLILATCYSIKSHPLAGSYSLFLYNCFFFSWTITCIAARRAVSWDTIALPEEPWVKLENDSPERLVPRSSSRLAVPARFSKIGELVGHKSALPPPHEPTGDRLYEERLKKLLQESLLDLQVTDKSFRYSLLRSQLAPGLKRAIDSHCREATTKATRASAVLKAGMKAMSEITNLYPAKAETLNHQGIEWGNLCDIAWGVAYEAAAAAEAARPDHWNQEWDRAWQMHWDARMNAEDTELNARLGWDVCKQAKAAWRAERTGLDSVQEEHVSEFIDVAVQGALENVPDIDDKRLRLGERASAKAVKRFFADAKASIMNRPTQPRFQYYMQMRILDHCERVGNIGFKSYEEALEKIEGAMQEIWVKTLEVLQGNDLALTRAL